MANFLRMCCTSSGVALEMSMGLVERAGKVYPTLFHLHVMGSSDGFVKRKTPSKSSGIACVGLLYCGGI